MIDFDFKHWCEKRSISRGTSGCFDYLFVEGAEEWKDVMPTDFDQRKIVLLHVMQGLNLSEGGVLWRRGGTIDLSVEHQKFDLAPISEVFRACLGEAALPWTFKASEVALMTGLVLLAQIRISLPQDELCVIPATGGQMMYLSSDDIVVLRRKDGISPSWRERMQWYTRLWELAKQRHQ